MAQNIDAQSAKRRLEELSPNKNDGSPVGSMAVTDLMKLMSTLMDEKLTNMKQDVEEIKNNVSGLSLKLDEVKSENQLLKNEITQLREEREKDHQQIVYLQEHIKRNNLIFKGIDTKSTLEDSVRDCCKNNLKISEEIVLLSTRKLYEKNGKVGVVAEFSSGEAVKDIFKNTKNLAGSKIIVERDLTTEKQQDKRVMLELKKRIKEVSSKHKIMVRNEKIKISDKWLMWNKNKILISGNQNGNVVLENLYGQAINSVNFNYHEILTKLNSKNY